MLFTTAHFAALGDYGTGALPGAAELLAKRMRAVFEIPIETGGHGLELDLCIGVAVYPRDGEDDVSLLANADAALYRQARRQRRDPPVY